MKMKYKARILVVDDDHFTLDLVCSMLTDLGYETTAARNGFEALKRVSSDDGYHVVLTDINMPQMDGWQLAQGIKALDPCMPVIAATGEAQHTVLPRLKGSGIAHVLFKPLILEHLREAISSVLEAGSVSCAPASASAMAPPAAGSSKSS